MKKKRNLTPMGFSSFGNLTLMGLMMRPQFPYLKKKKSAYTYSVPTQLREFTMLFAWKFQNLMQWQATLLWHHSRLIFMSMSYIKCVHFIFKVCALNFLGFRGLLCLSHFPALSLDFFFFFIQIIILNGCLNKAVFRASEGPIFGTLVRRNARVMLSLENSLSRLNVEFSRL